MGQLIENLPTEVTEAVVESLRMIQKARFQSQPDRQEAAQSLPSLLERCEKYISEDCQSRKEPVRIIHHFACTGGTLIAKCLACSPNAQVLSEVDPLSPIVPANTFNPTDMIQLLQHGNRGASTEDKLALFRATFSVLYDTASRRGLRMLVRDHTHSHFCTGEIVPKRPTLGQILADGYETRAIITVRHPLDSWLSLVHNGWTHFNPATLEEYAQRYQAFLAAYPNVRIFKYEDFVAHTDEVLGEMCTELDIPFSSDFRSLFIAHTFSGDSGRKGDVIASRDRKPVGEELMLQTRHSPAFRALCQQLQYES